MTIRLAQDTWRMTGLRHLFVLSINNLSFDNFVRVRFLTYQTKKGIIITNTSLARLFSRPNVKSVDLMRGGVSEVGQRKICSDRHELRCLFG
jgi:hypothetical protein